MNTQLKTMISVEQKAFAYLFVNELPKNITIAEAWSNALKEVQSEEMSVAEKLDSLDHVLYCLGYPTKAQAVLDLLQIDFWNQTFNFKHPVSSPENFVKELLQNPSLYHEWSCMIQTAIAINDLSMVEQWLKKHGFHLPSVSNVSQMFTTVAQPLDTPPKLALAA